MLRSQEDKLICRENYENPQRKIKIISLNPTIKLDISHKTSPYFCCSFHEEEFQSDFLSEEELIKPDEELSEICFLEGEEYIDQIDLGLHSEVGIQCTLGTPVSLKYLSTLPVICSSAKTLTPRTNRNQITLHEPLLTIPNIYDESGIPLKKDIYQCKYCFKTFLTGQALGGHMSKNHLIRKAKK